MNSKPSKILPSADMDLFSIGASSARAYILACWEKVAASKPVLFGAGAKGRQTLGVLRAAGIEPLCFADDTIEKQGAKEGNITIYSLEQALIHAGAHPVVIVCLFTPRHSYAQTAERIRRAADDATVIPFFTALLACQKNDFTSYYLEDPEREILRMPVYRALYDALEDDESRAVLKGHLRLRLLHDASLLPTTRNDIPFFLPVLWQAGLTYVDAGAFDGDTLVEFLHLATPQFAHAFALEPDEKNRHEMEDRLKQLPVEVRKKITVLPEGVWKESGKIGFTSVGNMGSAISDDATERISVIALDDLLGQISLPILIKLDVEGAEMSALAGATNLIKNSRPAWAISAYHKPSDLTDIFQWLEATQMDYKYALRCHGGDGSDLMLYAW